MGSDYARFYGRVNINQMERDYRDRFKGNEHDICYSPGQSLGMDVRIELPSMVRIADIEQEASAMMTRSLNKLAREIAELYERAQEKKSEARDA